MQITFSRSIHVRQSRPGFAELHQSSGKEKIIGLLDGLGKIFLGSSDKSSGATGSIFDLIQHAMGKNVHNVANGLSITRNRGIGVVQDVMQLFLETLNLGSQLFIVNCTFTMRVTVLLVSAPNIAIKPTRILRAAYLVR